MGTNKLANTLTTIQVTVPRRPRWALPNPCHCSLLVAGDIDFAKVHLWTTSFKNFIPTWLPTYHMLPRALNSWVFPRNFKRRYQSPIMSFIIPSIFLNRRWSSISERHLLVKFERFSLAVRISRSAVPFCHEKFSDKLDRTPIKFVAWSDQILNVLPAWQYWMCCQLDNTECVASLTILSS